MAEAESVSDNDGEESKATASVPLPQDGTVSNDITESSSEELSKSAPPKRRLVIKRSSLRKNADSANSSADSAEESSVVESQTKRRKMDESAVNMSSMNESSTSTTLPSISHAQSTPYYDATCIDKSVPLPDDDKAQMQNKRSYNKTENLASRNRDVSSNSREKRTAVSTSKVPQNTQKKVSVLKIKRKRNTAPVSNEKVTQPIKGAVSEVDLDASLLLSPMEESKLVGEVGDGEKVEGGAIVERKKSIAEMKAEM